MKTDAFEMRKRAGRRLGEMIAAQKATVDREAAEAELAWARNQVFVAVNAVLAPVAQWVLEQGRAARGARLIAQEILPRLLQQRDRGPSFSSLTDDLNALQQRQAPLVEIRAEVQHFLAGNFDEEQVAARRLAAEMEAAVAALTTDASAELPTLSGERA